jgi:gliding motility-associated-like protein
VTVTDPANGCTAAASVTVAQNNTLPNVSIAPPAVLSCSVSSVTLAASSSTPNVTYLWSNNATAATTSVSSAATYSVTVTDLANGCTAASSATVNQYSALNISLVKQDLLCNNINTGIIDISVSGGFGNYTYLWNDGITSEDRSQLSASTYSVTVTDNNNCSASTSVTIDEPAAVTILETHIDILCSGDNNGSINLSVNGGQLPYSFSWNDGVTTKDRSNLIFGTYNVTVSDQNNCTATISVSLTQPPQLIISSSSQDAGCNGANNGSIDIFVSGGIMPYSFLWNDGVTTEDRNNLPPSSYKVTVTDNNGCSVMTTEIVSELAAFLADFVITDETCSGKLDGSINVVLSGGASPFTYIWSNGMTTRDVTGLAAGNYTVTITDANNCRLIETQTVDILTTLSINSEIENASCPPVADGKIKIIVSGGTAQYNFTWSNGFNSSDNIDLSPGNYSVTAIDANNCTISGNYSVIYEYTLGVNVNATPPDTIIRGESVQLDATSNNSPVTFEWIPADGLNCWNCASPVATPEKTKTYIVTALSSTGCLAYDTITIYVIERENIYAPSGFSPNGDGFNDYFTLNGVPEDVETFYVVVFDRWGEKVFESEDPNFYWDGIFKGKPLNPAVFVYHMKYKIKNIPKLYERKGSVTLIR